MSVGTKWSATLKAKEKSYTLNHKSEKGRISELIEKLTNTLTDGDDTKFSKGNDLIEIKLVGPNLPDLTIIDLPGIVRTTTTGQSEDVKAQVDNMLKHYLKQERTIILAVIPCNVDIATVDILERASKVDPEGKRTIGVLTKPDLVDKGAEDEVMNVLMNRTKPLLHGYYMLKNPSQFDVDATKSKGSSKSVQSTDSSKVTQLKEKSDLWLKGSHYASSLNTQDRLGVDALTTALTSLLVERIKTSLPSIESEIRKKLKEAEDELFSLGGSPPSKPKECRAKLCEIIRQIMKSMRSQKAYRDYVYDSDESDEDGDESDEDSDESDEDDDDEKDKDKVKFTLGIVQHENRVRKVFKKEIEASRPGFEGENDTFDVEVVEVVRRNGEEKRRIYKKVKRTTPQSITKVGEKISVNDCDTKVIKLRSYFRGNIAELLDTCRGRELPGFLNFEVFKTIFSSLTKKWKPTSMSFTEKVKDYGLKEGAALCHKHTSSFQHLENVICSLMNKHYAQLYENYEARIDVLMAHEHIPVTMNHYFYDNLNKIRNDRNIKKIDALQSDYEPGYLSIETVKALLKSDIGNDSNESQEVQDMLDILQAYWKVAFKRYVDNVCQLITELFTSDASFDSIEEKLLENLVYSRSNEEVVALFDRDPLTKQRFEVLDDTRKVMKKACERLQKGVVSL